VVQASYNSLRHCDCLLLQILCDLDVNCTDVAPNTICFAGVCCCAYGYYITSDGTECQQLVIGTTGCTSGDLCLSARSWTACVNGVCQCSTAAHLNKTLNQCIPVGVSSSLYSMLSRYVPETCTIIIRTILIVLGSIFYYSFRNTRDHSDTSQTHLIILKRFEWRK